MRKGVEKVKAAKGKGSQGRLESFFGAITSNRSTIGVKREAETAKGAKGKLTNAAGAKKSKGVGGAMKKK